LRDYTAVVQLNTGHIPNKKNEMDVVMLG